MHAGLSSHIYPVYLVLILLLLLDWTAPNGQLGPRLMLTGGAFLQMFLDCQHSQDISTVINKQPTARYFIPVRTVKNIMLVVRAFELARF